MVWKNTVPKSIVWDQKTCLNLHESAFVKIADIPESQLLTQQASLFGSVCGLAAALPNKAAAAAVFSLQDN